LIISLFVAVVLAFVVDDFVYTVLVAPVLYVFWFVTLVLSSLSQVVYWTALIVVALIVAARSTPKVKTVRREKQVRLVENQGAVATWTKLLQGAEKSEFFKWRLAQALRRFAQDLLYPRKRESLEGRERSKLLLDLPPEIEAYFQVRIPGTQSRFWFWRRRLAGQRPTALDLDPETVVVYLENKLDPLLGE
jgi:energy-coupling factor transporter transmembrane protein EcfT